MGAGFGGNWPSESPGALQMANNCPAISESLY